MYYIFHDPKDIRLSYVLLKTKGNIVLAWSDWVPTLDEISYSGLEEANFKVSLRDFKEKYEEYISTPSLEELKLLILLEK